MGVIWLPFISSTSELCESCFNALEFNGNLMLTTGSIIKKIQHFVHYVHLCILYDFQIEKLSFNETTTL